MNYTRQAFIESSGRYNYGLEIKFDDETLRVIAADETLRRHIGDVAYALGERVREAHERADKDAMSSYAKERADILSCFPEGCRHELIVNDYDKNPNRPWMTVYTWVGPFEVGWRKRVIELKWHRTVLYKNIPYGLFDGEDVTRSEAYIHAWGIEKLRDYVQRLMTCEPLRA